MTPETSLTPRQKRVPLKGVPPTSFQHPLDRQATENLKKIKGFDWLVGKFIEYGFERIDYITHIGGGIRIGPKQMSKHYAMLRECCDILDVSEPESNAHCRSQSYCLASAIILSDMRSRPTPELTGRENNETGIQVNR